MRQREIARDQVREKDRKQIADWFSDDKTSKLKKIGVDVPELKKAAQLAARVDDGEHDTGAQVLRRAGEGERQGREVLGDLLGGRRPAVVSFPGRLDSRS